MLLLFYKHYLSIINCSNDSSSSKKIPNLKIFKILNFSENFILIKIKIANHKTYLKISSFYRAIKAATKLIRIVLKLV